MSEIKFYWLPNCSTCKKAKAFLEQSGAAQLDLRDIKSEPLSRFEVEDLAVKVGGAGELFSRRAIKYREMRLNERELTDEEMLELMSEEYTFLKRPIVVAGTKALAGFNEKTWKQLLEEN